MENERWMVYATDADTLEQVGFIDSGSIDDDEHDAGNIVELSDEGCLAVFHMYRRPPVGDEPEVGSIGYDQTVTVILAEPASTYRDVFTTEWATCDVD
jgi:hypothetical protein